jgi:hypothetical protein
MRNIMTNRIKGTALSAALALLFTSAAYAQDELIVIKSEVRAAKVVEAPLTGAAVKTATGIAGLMEEAVGGIVPTAAIASLAASGGRIPDLKYPANQLPESGERRYVPKKQKGDPPAVRSPEGGYEDSDGNRWEWTKDPHGGPHWDVQHPGTKRHTNVAPDGTVIGTDRFPNKPK